MKVISTLTHGIIDYLSVLLLFFAPNIFGFEDLGGAAVGVPRLLAAVVLIQSLLTDYELGMMRLIPMRTHLMTDYVLGALLLVSPWLFAFNDQPANVWAPHVVVGIAVLAISYATQTAPVGSVTGTGRPITGRV
jgi:hypothetical protein